MEFKQLQSFAAVVRYSSFTEAAEKLYISQPTISTHIRMLEEELQTSLILRTTKKIELTEKGRELYEYAVNLLDLRDRMLRRCSGDREQVIHLGASTIPSAHILPEILPEYGKLHPEVSFLVHQGDSQSIVDDLLDGMFDLGLIGMRCEEEELVCVPFCQDRMVLITPADERFQALKTAGETSLAALLQEPILLREAGSGSRKSMDRLLESIGFDETALRVTARLDDQEAIKNLVVAGLGVSIISERAARDLVADGRLLAFDLPEEAARRELYLVFRKNSLLKGYGEEFVEYLKQHYRAG